MFAAISRPLFEPCFCLVKDVDVEVKLKEIVPCFSFIKIYGKKGIFFFCLIGSHNNNKTIVDTIILIVIH